MMNVIKKVILCSLCLLKSSFLFSAQNDTVIDLGDDLIILCGGQEEIYPIEDVDTICTIEDIQSYIDDLEFDPMALPTDLVQLPCAPADIVILGQGDVVAQEVAEDLMMIVREYIEPVVEVIEADEPEMPITLSVDFTDTSFEAQDVDEYPESDYLLPEVIEEIIIDVEILTPADQEVLPSDDNQVSTEVVDVVVVAEVASVQTEVVDTVKDSKKKNKKGFFNRSKKNKDKK